MYELPILKDTSLTVDERVAVLTFKRDDVRNALSSTDLGMDIVTAITWARAEPEVSVLIMTGEGSAFSAGGNIKTMGNLCELSGALPQDRGPCRGAYRLFRKAAGKIPRKIGAGSSGP